EWALGHRKTVLFGTLLLVVASLGLTPFIGATFLPESDQGQLSMAIEIREGAELEETKAVIEDIDEKLKKYKDTIDIGYVTIGGGSSGFGASSSNTAEYIIQLVDSEQRSLSTTQVIKGIEKELKDIPGAKITVSSMESGMQTGSPIDIKISGPELDVLEDLSQQVVWMLEDIEGTNNIESSVAESRPQMEVEVKRDLVHQYGLSYQQVMNAVKTAFDGQTATRYREDGSEYDVRVLLPEEERESIRDLESMFIRTNDGIEVPLSTVAELKQTQGPAEINRENQQRQVSVTSDVRDRDLGSVNADITASIEQLYLPEGYTVSLGGQTEEMMESFTSLGLALVLSIFLVYLVMAVQFESLAYPFVVMFSLPTTVVGVLIGLAVTQKPLSVPAFIGLIMLAGIVVNNAIVLVDYINLQRSKGMGRREAVIDAGLSRLRPIFMTTLTTVLAMVPLALEIGEGAESQSPMAVVIIFGLLTSTIFTLVVIPVVYTLIDDMTNKFKNKKFKRIKFRRKNKEIEA
ncbi:MAG TPA: efflux RND transporter permease subunit, partial [Chondromyces sp.]|nr:efflux RND transporter permease subunit [Chondromyces sp.]